MKILKIKLIFYLQIRFKRIKKNNLAMMKFLQIVLKMEHPKEKGNLIQIKKQAFHLIKKKHKNHCNLHQLIIVVAVNLMTKFKKYK